jgi:hypothetical protein
MPVTEAGVEAAVCVDSGVDVALDLTQQRGHRGASALGDVDEVDLLRERLEKRFYSLLGCRFRSHWGSFRRRNCGGGDGSSTGPAPLVDQAVCLLRVAGRRVDLLRELRAVVTWAQSSGTSICAGHRIYLILQPTHRASLLWVDREPE